VDLGRGAKFLLVAKESDDNPAQWAFGVEQDGATASVSAAPYTFVWDFGDGQSYEGEDQAYTSPSRGRTRCVVHAMETRGMRPSPWG